MIPFQPLEEQERIMNILDKIALVKPQIMLSNGQVINIVNSNMYRKQIPTLIPTCQIILAEAQNTMKLYRISTVTGTIAKQQLALCNEKAIGVVTNSIYNTILQILETQRKFINAINEKMNRNVFPVIKALLASLEEAKNNPNSLLSWKNYYDRLSDFFGLCHIK